MFTELFFSKVVNDLCMSNYEIKSVIKNYMQKLCRLLKITLCHFKNMEKLHSGFNDKRI